MEIGRATLARMTGIGLVALIVAGCSWPWTPGGAAVPPGGEEMQVPLSVPADPDHVVAIGDPLPSDFRALVESIDPAPELEVDWHIIVQIGDALYLVEVVSVQHGPDEDTAQVPMVGSGFAWDGSGSAVYLWYDLDTGVVTHSLIQIDGNQLTPGEVSLYIVKAPFSG